MSAERPRLVKDSAPPFTAEQLAWLDRHIEREVARRMAVVQATARQLRRVLRSAATDLERVEKDFPSGR